MDEKTTLILKVRFLEALINDEYAYVDKSKYALYKKLFCVGDDYETVR